MIDLHRPILDTNSSTEDCIIDAIRILKARRKGSGVSKVVDFVRRHGISETVVIEEIT